MRAAGRTVGCVLGIESINMRNRSWWLSKRYQESTLNGSSIYELSQSDSGWLVVDWLRGMIETGLHHPGRALQPESLQPPR